MDLLKEKKQEMLDIAKGIADVWQGAPLDPKRFATAPPKWWKKKDEKPVADPPPKKRKQVPNAREFWGSTMLAECYEMTDYDWSVKYGQYSVIRWNEKFQADNEHRFRDREEMIEWLEQEMMADEQAQQNRVVDFDGEMVIELSKREYGELRTYKNHKLDNYELASKVKLWKSQGHSLREISDKTGEEYWLIKHYSSALKKAEN